jgi:hypothetical protein
MRRIYGTSLAIPLVNWFTYSCQLHPDLSRDLSQILQFYSLNIVLAIASLLILSHVIG